MNNENIAAMQDWIKRETSLQKQGGIEFKPVILSEIIGDGMQLIWVSSMNDSPYYWLARIDSSLDIDELPDWKGDDLREMLLDMIEDEFGAAIEWMPENEFLENIDEINNFQGTDYSCYADFEKDYESSLLYPNMNFGTCAQWGVIVNLNTGN
jgi:hypothetical protein